MSPEQADEWVDLLIPSTLEIFWMLLLPIAAFLHVCKASSNASNSGLRVVHAISTIMLLGLSLGLVTNSARRMNSITSYSVEPSLSEQILVTLEEDIDFDLDLMHISSSYGLFRRMTGVGASSEVARAEIIIEGSDDGIDFFPYEFKYKPGDLARMPGIVAPHQPRLDWQMWFAALSSYQNNPW